MKEEKKPAQGSKIYKKRSYWRGWDNVKIFGFDFHARVFLISAAVIIIFVVAGTMFQEQTAEILVNAHHWVVTRFYWWFMTAANIILLFCLLLMVSPLAKVRLGGRDAKPDYSYVSWFAMIIERQLGLDDCDNYFRRSTSQREKQYQDILRLQNGDVSSVLI